MQRLKAASILLLVLATLFSGCEGESDEGEATYYVGGDYAVVLPPGHPAATIDGTTIKIPGETTPPLIHYANCFAGVPTPGDFGIGTSAGFTRDYIGYTILPVNINTGDTALGSYRIRVDVSDPSVEIALASIVGSNKLLPGNNCIQRGCPSTCVDTPVYYPPEFDPAKGFEKLPQVAGTVAGVTIQSSDTTDLSSPASGTLNLCNIRLNIVGSLPVGGVDLTFTVDELSTSDGDTVYSHPLSGLVIENIQIQ